MYVYTCTTRAQVRQSDAPWEGYKIATLIVMMIMAAGLTYWSRHVRFRVRLPKVYSDPRGVWYDAGQFLVWLRIFADC